MKQTISSVIQRLRLGIYGPAQSRNNGPENVTKEEMLRVFAQLLPEPCPKRDC